METIILILIYLAWLSFSTAQGIREAWFFHYKYDSGYTKYDPHAIFTWSRISAILLSASCFMYYNWWIYGLLVISLILLFPFWHEGAYYYKRNKLDNCYPYGWFTNNNTSTAKLSIQKGWLRTVLAFGSLLILAFLIYKTL